MWPCGITCWVSCLRENFTSSSLGRGWKRPGSQGPRQPFTRQTFFWNFKQALNCHSWRVFSCWEAIDRLLTAAHMAYLVIVMMAEFAMRGRTAEMRGLMERLEKILRSRFARSTEEMTLGRFMRLLAMDFPSPRLAQVLL